MRYCNILALVLVAVLLNLSTGCAFSSGVRAVGDATYRVSGAKDRDHFTQNEIRRDTETRSKKAELVDLFTDCLRESGGDIRPCQGYRTALAEYTVNVDGYYGYGGGGYGYGAGGYGYDPAIRASVYGHYAGLVQSDFGQNYAINNLTGRTGELEVRVEDNFDTNYAQWGEIDRVEKESKGRDVDLDNKARDKFGRVDDDTDDTARRQRELEARLIEIEAELENQSASETEE